MSYAQKIEAARKREHKLRDAIYAVAYPRRDVVFSDCRQMASPELRQAYQEAIDATWAAEWAAIDAGRGWRDAYGHYQPYANPRSRRRAA